MQISFFCRQEFLLENGINYLSCYYLHFLQIGENLIWFIDYSVFIDDRVSVVIRRIFVDRQDKFLDGDNFDNFVDSHLNATPSLPSFQELILWENVPKSRRYNFALQIISCHFFCHFSPSVESYTL